MWRLPFMPKEQNGLEGRSIDVGILKLHVRNAIAEGGFSCVYLARDVIHPMKQYALKHIICNDKESLELVMKETAVLKLLKGHPNIVTLCADTIVDMGRTKEAFLVMEFCDKSLVSVIESRGAGYFEEKQVLSIFRDISNAVFAMHCQSPPIAHRDLKAENLLLASDGLWKLCDFGSTSTNHKRFEKPEEMGIEEDNIRKHTTPAYRAPEMWDLFRREVINEKVDIWALGCLLFRICYFKSAFDGESKLQVLNGNYRIPELPRYSSSIADLIRDMLQPSPVDRPDITQVWFRVNEQLPASLQKSLPDRSPEMVQAASDITECILKPANKPSPIPRRTPPPPPSSKEPAQSSAPIAVGEDGGPLGAFWATQHAKDSVTPERPKGTKFNEEGSEAKLSKSVNAIVSQNESFDSFVAEFDVSKLSPEHVSNTQLGNERAQEAEVERLKKQLQRTSLEKAEIASKYEKLSAICRSQRQEIQELKQAVAARAALPNRDPLGNMSQSPDSKAWQAFAGEPRPQVPPRNTATKSVRTRSSPPNKHASNDLWGFETESFTAAPAGGSQISGSACGGTVPQFFAEPKNADNNASSQPAGWAGF